MQQEIAASLLKKENDKAKARAILNRPTSAVPGFLATVSVVGLGTCLQAFERFEAPLWVTALLVAGVGGAVLNMIDSWTTRRRLDAAITLLELQNGPGE